MKSRRIVELSSSLAMACGSDAVVFDVDPTSYVVAAGVTEDLTPIEVTSGPGSDPLYLASATARVIAFELTDRQIESSDPEWAGISARIRGEAVRPSCLFPWTEGAQPLLPGDRCAVPKPERVSPGADAADAEKVLSQLLLERAGKVPESPEGVSGSGELEILGGEPVEQFVLHDSGRLVFINARKTITVLPGGARFESALASKQLIRTAALADDRTLIVSRALSGEDSFDVVEPVGGVSSVPVVLSPDLAPRTIKAESFAVAGSRVIIAGLLVPRNDYAESAILECTLSGASLSCSGRWRGRGARAVSSLGVFLGRGWVCELRTDGSLIRGTDPGELEVLAPELSHSVSGVSATSTSLVACVSGDSGPEVWVRPVLDDSGWRKVLDGLTTCRLGQVPGGVRVFDGTYERDIDESGATSAPRFMGERYGVGALTQTIVTAGAWTAFQARSSIYLANESSPAVETYSLGAATALSDVLADDEGAWVFGLTTGSILRATTSTATADDVAGLQGRTLRAVARADDGSVLGVGEYGGKGWVGRIDLNQRTAQDVEVATDLRDLRLLDVAATPSGFVVVGDSWTLLQVDDQWARPIDVSWDDPVTEAVEGRPQEVGCVERWQVPTDGQDQLTFRSVDADGPVAFVVGCGGTILRVLPGPTPRAGRVALPSGLETFDENSQRKLPAEVLSVKAWSRSAAFGSNEHRNESASPVLLFREAVGERRDGFEIVRHPDFPEQRDNFHANGAVTGLFGGPSRLGALTGTRVFERSGSSTFFLPTVVWAVDVAPDGRAWLAGQGRIYVER